MLIDFLFNRLKKKQYLLLSIDIVILFTTILIAYIIRFIINGDQITVAHLIEKLDPRHSFIIIIQIFMLYSFNQYNLNQLKKREYFNKQLIIGLSIGAVLISSIFFFFPKYIFGRQVLMIQYFLSLVFLGYWRKLFSTKFIKLISQKLLVIGGFEQLTSFYEEMQFHPDCGYTITGAYVRDDEGYYPLGIKSDNSKCSLDSVVKQKVFEVIAYDTRCQYFSDKEIEYILALKYQGKIIYDLPSLYQNFTGKAPIDYIDSNWLLFNKNLQGRESPYYIRIKRLIEFFLSVVLLIITAPLLILISIAIKLNSKGPALFIQERLCEGRKKFKCIKFRTMKLNAEIESGPVWGTENIDKITGAGKFLRKSRLDELPQLWNILKGEMSFVGPRPIREHFANKLSQSIPFYELRFNVKPGLSGWAQVNSGYADSIESQNEKFQYELFYLQNLSFFIDVIVIIKTIQKVLKGEGK